ncbi:MAG TPA: NUDIX hydrolase [Mycobacteriales bacterium]|nr:NUDIX hydrolase [Mycobacteriales bacterium]
MRPDSIRAAGAVLWRPAGEGVEVAVVHRPRYDDWSLPKGKLQPGEPAVLGAVREVLEETGHQAVLGRRLGRQNYDKLLSSGPVPKVVQFWAMRADGGAFDPGDEVDELAWLPVGAARQVVTLDRDRDVLAAFTAAAHDTRPLVVVRHGSAGSRDGWAGDDRSRPLDDAGTEQAKRLADILAAYGVARVISADVDRCVETVAPFADRARIDVEVEPLLGESAYQADPAGALKACLAALGTEQPTALCTQRRVVAPLTADLLNALGVATGGLALAKGACAVLHVSRGDLVDVEQHPPLEDAPEEGSR